MSQHPKTDTDVGKLKAQKYSKLVYEVLVSFRMSYKQGQHVFLLISLFIVFANIQNQECFTIPLSVVPHNPFLEIVLDQASKLAYDIRNLPSPR